MSSSTALERKVAPKKAAASAHAGVSHGHRADVLAERIVLHIESLVPRGRARCLDVGCGDMTLVEAIQARKARTDWRCIDVHDVPSKQRDDARWLKYSRFDGRTIPFADGEFDVALLCDVLHHAPEDAAQLLAEAARVARHVLVKDHFTREAFARLATEQRLFVTALDAGLALDDGLPVSGALLHSDGQFIAVLRSG
jgi:2-polyprenyl-3-methyl-5-hydroxy-6-metoxy-1,4-benzoquinol methylase